MDTNFTESYKKWIEKLSKPNFDELVEKFLKEYYETKELYLCDGPYDGGMDLVYRINGDEQKKNIQISVQQTNIEKKIDEDILKSKRNVMKYGYLSSLDFYTSKVISPQKKRELIRLAEINHQITLKIIDANELAGLASEYRSIRDTIFKFNKTAFPEESIKIDNSTKILYDILSMGKDITSIKNNFIQSLILTHLYSNPDCSVEDIYQSLNSTFYNKFDKSFFESEIGRLKAESKIIDIPKTRPKQFKLTDAVQNKIEEIANNTESQESDLVNSLKCILNKFGLDNETENITTQIIELYKANYEIDENELLKGDITNIRVQKVFQQLISYLKKRSDIDESTANDITRQLLVQCSKNDFLNKTSVSHLFTSLFKSDKLDSYLSNSERVVYLDTQILLQYICNQHVDIDSDDRLYNDVKYLIKVVSNSDIPISLYTTLGYIEEVAWHLFNGLKLERFLALDYIRDLGPSKNIFFNYYLELKSIYPDDFENYTDFIEELLDVECTQRNDRRIVEDFIRNLKDRFELMGITVVESARRYENYAKYKKQYEVSLSYLKNDQKSQEARKNDLNTILLLSSEHFLLEEGYFTEPYLITWDSSFYNIRSDFKNFHELNYWYVYSPMKFANTISVMNMRIDSDAINYNIISLVEDNFNLSNEAVSFLDILNDIFKGGNVKNWKLANKMAKIRKKQLRDYDLMDFSKTRSKSLPIDEFVLHLQKHYQSHANQKNYTDLISLFQNNDFADRISNLIESNIDNFLLRNKIKDSIVAQIDKMIEENAILQNSIEKGK